MYKCPFCEFTASKFWILKEHAKKMHLFGATQCPLCGAPVSPRNGALREHAMMKWITTANAQHLYLAILLGTRSKRINTKMKEMAKSWVRI